MRRLLERTGLGVDALAARLLKLVDEDEDILSLKSQLRMYLSGKRTASIAVQGRSGASWVVLADRLSPGSFWDFCDPLFDLLEELYFWHQPQRAHERFLRRIQQEALVADRASGRREKAGWLIPRFETSWQKNYNRLRRIRRAMVAIDDRNVECLFAPMRRHQGYIRTVRDSEVEGRFVSLPPTLRDFSTCFALYLESIELADLSRFQTFWPVLSATKCALSSELSLRPIASEVLALIDTEAPMVDDFLQSEGDTRIARTTAPMDYEAFAARDEDCRQLALNCVNLIERLQGPMTSFLI
jgi:hypothetical protein